LIGGAGADVLDGGDGRDLVDYSASLAGVTVDLAAGTGLGGDAEGDRLYNIEIVTGSALSDIVLADGEANALSGGAGDDTLDGRSGADTLFGGTGNDSLVGGLGDDLLIGGEGADILNGGEGTDTASYQDASSTVLADLATGGGTTVEAAGDSYLSIENLTGSTSSDQLSGDGTDNVLTGLGGHDLLYGRDGNDTIDGGAGNDTLVGGTGEDALIGGGGTDLVAYWDAISDIVANLIDPGTNTGVAAGDTYDSIENLAGGDYNDSLSGDSGNNLIIGGTGNDTLAGSLGNDTLDGGSGNDTYIYALGDGNETITDYSDIANDDVLILSDIASSDVTVRRLTSDPNDVVITMVNGKHVTLLDQLTSGDQYGIEQIVFSDDVTWTRTNLATAPIVDDELVYI